MPCCSVALRTARSPFLKPSDGLLRPEDIGLNGWLCKQYAHRAIRLSSGFDQALMRC